MLFNSLELLPPPLYMFSRKAFVSNHVVMAQNSHKYNILIFF